MENTYDRTLFCNCIINHNNNEEDEVIVSIKDTGIGIHPPILPKLFTKFVSASPKGTGLGLYICRSIVEAHGGKIWAENDINGNGATFMFSLPIDKDLLYNLSSLFLVPVTISSVHFCQRLSSGSNGYIRGSFHVLKEYNTPIGIVKLPFFIESKTLFLKSYLLYPGLKRYRQVSV